MRIIEIVSQNNGAHRNQSGQFGRVPPGWAIVPDEMALPDSFPFVDIEVSGNVVTKMTAKDVPTPEPDPASPTQEERLSALESAMLAMMEVQNV